MSKLAPHRFFYAVLAQIAFAVERHVFTIMAAVLVLYFAAAISISHRIPFTSDELLVYAQAQLPDVGSLWYTLIHHPTVVDPPLHPLLSFLLFRTKLPHDVALRMPSVFGYAFFAASVFVALRRSPRAVALGAFAIALALPAKQYAYEARPYAMLLAFAGGAFVAWQQAASAERRKTWHIAALWLLLACAVLTHYFAVFLFFPFVVGEWWRFKRSRIPDYRTWAAIAAASLTLAAYFPFLKAASVYRIQPWHGVLAEDLRATYELGFGPSTLVMLMVLCLFQLTRRLQSEEPPGRHDKVFPPHEAIAVGAFYAVPALAFLFAALLTHSFVPRYALIFLVGAVPLTATALWILSTRSAQIMPAVAVLLLLPIVHSSFAGIGFAATNPDYVDPAELTLFQRFARVPIALPDWDPGARLFLFGPADLRGRFILIHKTPPSVALSQTLGIPLAHYEPFVEANREFLMITSGWMRDKAVAGGARVTSLGRVQGDELSLVEMRP